MSGRSNVPAFAVVAALGVLLFSLSFTLARAGLPLAGPLYWIGFLVITGPITVRLASVSAGERERVGLVIVMGLALYLVAFLRSPASFTGYDELQHYRTLSDILESGHLFTPNSLLDVSPFFPALEMVTAAVVQVSGADPFSAAVVVLGFVRIAFVLALYMLYREVSASSRVAGLSTAIYMLNPNFTFFDAQFAYESLALPLMLILLAMTASRARMPERRTLHSGVVVVVGVTLVATHHVTSYETALLLFAWLAISLARGGRDVYRTSGIALVAAVVGIGALGWLINVASLTADYLGPPVVGAVQQFVRLLTEGQGRTLFQSSTGVIAPFWERFVGLGMAGLLTLAIPIGLVTLLRKLRHNSLALLLGLVAMAYPVSLVGRLTPTGGEAAGRSVAVIFVGLAFVVALAAVTLLDLPEPSRWLGRFVNSAWQRMRSPILYRLRAGLLVFALMVVTLGGVVAGSAPATRLPGPYLVGADSRSIDAESIGTAVWAREVLGANRRFAADRVNRLLLGSYGEQHVVFYGSDRIEEWQPFLSPVVGDAEIARLVRGEVKFIAIDRRLSSGLPLVPYYYEIGEIFEGPHRAPISPDVLGKWDLAPGVDRIYDSGNVQLYDLGALDAAR